MCEGTVGDFCEFIHTRALDWVEAFVGKELWYFRGMAEVADAEEENVAFKWPSKERANRFGASLPEILCVADFLSSCPTERMQDVFYKAGGASTLKVWPWFRAMSKCRFSAMQFLGSNPKKPKKDALQDKIRRGVEAWEGFNISLKSFAKEVSSVPATVAGRMIAVEDELVKKLAKELFEKLIQEWRDKCAKGKTLAKDRTLEVGAIDINGAGAAMVLVNSAEAEKLKDSWAEIKDLQDMPKEFAEMLDLELQEDTAEEHIQIMKNKVCDIVGLRSVHRPLKANESRTKVVGDASLTIEAVAGEDVKLEPALEMLMSQFAPKA